MNICFYLAIVIVLVLIVFKRTIFIFDTPLIIPLMFFLLWSALSIFWALNTENTISDVRKHLLNHIIFYFLLINSFHSMKRLESLAWIFALSAVAFSTIGIIYYYIVMDNPIGIIRLGYLTVDSINVSTEVPVDFIGVFTISAMLICLHFFFQESRPYHRAAIIACTIPLFVATILTQSNTAFVVLTIAITILLLIKARKIALLFLIIMILISFQTRNMTESLRQRLRIDYVTYEVIKDYPIKGIGFGMQTFIKNIDIETYVDRLPKKQRPGDRDATPRHLMQKIAYLMQKNVAKIVDRPGDIYTPHNLLLDIAVRVGLVGLIIFLFIIFIFGIMCRKIIRNARNENIKNWGILTAILFVGYFLIGIAEPLFLFSASASVFYIILAIVTILWRLNHEEWDIYGQPDTAN